MYRVICQGYSPGFHAQSFAIKFAIERGFRTCSFCKEVLFRRPGPPNSCQYFHRSQLQYYAIETRSATVWQQNSKALKKLRRTHKRYAELLEVTEGNSTEKRTKVNKLKAKEFSMLIEDPAVLDISVTSAEASEFLNTMTQSGESKLIEDAQEQEFLEEVAPELLEVAEPMESIIKQSKKSHQTKHNALLQMYQKLEQEGKSESLARSLTAYLDLCVHCESPQRGLSTLLAYRGRNKKQSAKTPAITSVKPFNVLLSGFAAKGCIAKVSEIMDILVVDKITPNMSTYVSCFECVGRLPNTSKNHLKLMSWASMMESQEFSLNALFQEGNFSGDQYEMVLRACRRLQPKFNPVLQSADISYTCNLLQELNSPLQKTVSKNICEDLLTTKQLQQLASEQMRMELRGSLTVKSIEKITQSKETTAYYREILAIAQEKWQEVVTDAFKRNLETLKIHYHSYKGLREITLYSFLTVLPEQQYIEIVMQEIRRLAEGSETFSPTLQLLYRDIGTRVLLRYQVQSKLQSDVAQKMQSVYHDYCRWLTNSNTTDFLNMRSKWQKLLEETDSGSLWNYEKKAWPNHILVSIGKFLYHIILRDIKLDVNMLRPGSKRSHILPAFYSLYRSQGRFVKEEIKPHPILSRLFRGAMLEDLTFDVEKVPMLCPPVPWSSIKLGGHLVANTDIIRLPLQAAQQWQRLLEAPQNQLYPILDALNQLGSIPWKINEPLLDLVTEVFNSGGSPELDIPEPPSACPPSEKITADMTKTERFQAYRKRLTLRRKKAEMYSLWCDTLYRLSLANHYRKRIFWLPHNMDFRGRVYPCPPHLNHMGSDLARSLLCFAKGEPLGKDGLNWLKIHIVNLTGLKKKESVKERLKYAEEIMPQILDSADNPLTGQKWWMQSDEPWQTLACCIEVAKASRSPSPEAYICHFPIHQDGSCNGLQHYAALGRDEAGAFSVNLAPASTPQDVYSCVAVLVEREREKDAAAGVKIAQILEGFIRRKVIKQTVMTTVYGVTRFGARLQIARQLKDIDTFPKDFVWQASTYLVGKTFDSLREMFTSTKEIQDWFTESARLISQVRGKNVEWVTPLGLPIVQPYSRFKKIDGITGSARRLQECFNMDMFERPNVMKQKNAFPPNFIHSLDSSHMMLTSLFCERRGITFVSVHDCYWTHPSTVDIMNEVCREQFVALHQQPILEDLSKFLSNRYSFPEVESSSKNSAVNAAKAKLNNVLSQVPKRGSFDLSQVLESVYFFS